MSTHATRTSRIVWWYCFAVLTFSVIDPEVRRVLDWRTGFHAFQALIVVPLLGMAAFAFILAMPARLAAVPRSIVLLVWIWIGSFVYAATIGILSGNGPSALYDFMQFVAPMFIALWLAGTDDPAAQMFRRFSTVILALATGVSLYGIFQFLAPPPWDVYWIQHVARESGMITNGIAAPFQVRVFSVLNSPAPCATFLAVALAINLYRLRENRIVPVAGMFLCCVTLALTLVRSAWVALIIAVVVYLLFSARPARIASAAVAISAVLLTFFLAISPWLSAQGGGDIVAQRALTFTQLNTDSSLSHREASSGTLLSEGLENPLGQGLGIIGTASQLTTFTQKVNAIDGGFQARFAEMGFAGFAGYVATVLLALTFVFRKWREATQSGDHAARDAAAALLAVQATLIIMDISIDSHGNLPGALFWIVIGIALARGLAHARAAEKDAKSLGYAGSPA